MSAKLSRRYGRVASAPPVLALPLEERFVLDHLTSARKTQFDDLPERYQHLLLEAETYCVGRRAIGGTDKDAAGAAAPVTLAPALRGR